jgi:ribokinase
MATDTSVLTTSTARGARVAVLGSINMDLVLRTHHLPVPGETVTASTLRYASGGKGANQAVAARRQGAAVTLIGCVGQDSFGETLRTQLQAEGVDISRVRRDPSEPTGMASVLVDVAGENCIAVLGGANLCLHEGDLAEATIDIQEAKVLLVQLESPPRVVLAAMQLARQAGVITLLNPSPLGEVSSDVLTALIEAADVLVVNESEAAQLCKLSFTEPLTEPLVAWAERAALGLQGMGGREIVITLGKDGLVHLSGHAQAVPVYRPAAQVVPVDTTAAGDCFVGVLAAHLAAGSGLVNAMMIAQVAAAISVTREGAQPSLPSAAEVAAALEALTDTLEGDTL